MSDNRIRFWRQHKGWTLQQLAEAAGTTRAQIDKLERGTRRLTVEWMVRLASPLGCDPRSLMPPMGLADSAAPAAALAPNLVPLFMLSAPPRRQGLRRAATDRQQVPAPYFLTNRTDTYGVILGKAVWRAPLHMGQTLFTVPTVKPRLGALCLWQTLEGEAWLGLLQRQTKQTITIAPWHGRRATISLPTQTVRTCSQIIALIDDL